MNLLSILGFAMGDQSNAKSMVLNKDRVRRFIKGASEAQFRDVGYDLTVGDIHVPKANDLKDPEGPSLSPPLDKAQSQYCVGPQELVLVFSKETVAVPNNVMGLAFPKTSLSDRGLLLLNTGIADPGYEGVLSGILINFSDTEINLERGEPFIRLVFMDVATDPLKVKKTYGDKQRKIDHARTFYRTFLNFPRTARRISDEVLRRHTDQIKNYFAIVAGVVAVATVFLPFLLFFLEGLRDSQSRNSQSQLDQNLVLFDQLTDEVHRLNQSLSEERIDNGNQTKQLARLQNQVDLLKKKRG